jgi:hypothetical protein
MATSLLRKPVMATFLAEAELADPRRAHDPTVCPPITFDSDTIGDPGRSVGRGIITAVLISTPLWALIAFTIYLLL